MSLEPCMVYGVLFREHAFHRLVWWTLTQSRGPGFQVDPGNLQQRNHKPSQLPSDDQRYQPTACRSTTDMDGCVVIGFRAGLGLLFINTHYI